MSIYCMINRNLLKYRIFVSQNSKTFPFHLIHKKYEKSLLSGSASMAFLRREAGPFLFAIVFIFLNCCCGMVVESLRHELKCEAVLIARCLFDFGPLILEPDFYLRLIEVEFLGQRLSPLLRNVPIRLKLGFKSLQLFSRESGSRSLVFLLAFLLFQFSCPWA